jgi:class 3 adenylate cyclase
MARGVKKQTFVWDFDSPVEAIWPILADTQRLNEAANFPKHAIEEIVQPDGGVTFVATARLGPYTLIWDDEPQNWVEGQWHRHCRYLRNGPLKSVCGDLRIAPRGDGCRIEFTLEVEARNLLGSLILATKFFSGSEKIYTKLAADAREFAAGRAKRAFAMAPVALAPGAEAKIADLSVQLDASDYGHGLAAKLAEYITTRPEVDLVTIRPLGLARLWDVPARLAIEACLQAAKIGLLGSRWNLLCPRCQVGKEPVENLGSMPRGTHCPSCNIDFERDYNNNLELAFYPSRAIRPIDGREYCLFGPMSTPHIKVQLTLEAGAQSEQVAGLEFGVYRLRTLEPGGESTVEWRSGGFPEVIAEGDDISAGPPSPPGTISFANRTERRRTFIIEEYTWKRDVLTAHQATTMQAFRELFDAEVLRPGDDVEIDNVTIMFTDFKGSTQLYERLGDSQAYHLIRQFFAVLGQAIRENNGTVVKTIGDAVNAAFSNAADGLAAAVQIQGDVARFNQSSGKEPMAVTIGLHVGRCISVTLNDQLDYYGTAANKAARLEGQSRGGDVVVSREFAEDPAVSDRLKGFNPVLESAELKGFEGLVEYFRIPASALVDPSQMRPPISGESTA